MGLKDLFNTPGSTKLKGVQLKFEFDANSTLHNTSSLNGIPAFSTYARPYLKTLRPVDPKYRANLTPRKYLDNLPG